MYGKQVGGAELQFIELANYLADKYLVRLVSLGGDGSIKAADVDSRIKVKVYAYNGKISVILALMRAWFDCLRFKADAIVTTSVIGSILGYAISIFRQARLISLQTVSKSMKYPQIDRFVLRRFDYFVAGAADIRQFLMAHGQKDEKIMVVHNWVDFSKRTLPMSATAAKEKFGVINKFVIGCVGRLHEQKGQIFLIRAFARIIDDLPSGILLLVGEGPERSFLELEVAKLHLQDRVIFLGEVKGDDYNAVFSAIDIYVQPSLFEGLPRTLLDAMFFGKPIVATNANGNREAIIDGENGILVPIQDEAALREKILYLVTHVKIRNDLASSAKAVVLAGFEMKNQLKKIEQLI